MDITTLFLTTQYSKDDIVSSLTTDEKWEAVRSERNKLLHDTDWTQLPDTKVDKEAYAIYRQKLRDIPQTYKLPDEVKFPTLLL